MKSSGDAASHKARVPALQFRHKIWGYASRWTAPGVFQYFLFFRRDMFVKEHLLGSFTTFIESLKPNRYSLYNVGYALQLYWPTLLLIFIAEKSHMVT